MTQIHPKYPGLILLALLMLPVSLQAADKKELQGRFEKRYPTLVKYKSDGKVGETSSGLLEAVDSKFLSDATLKKLIDDENSDRHELYEIIAKEEKITVDKVADRAAIRNFEKAKSGDYLKRDGKWSKKP